MAVNDEMATNKKSDRTGTPSSTGGPAATVRAVSGVARVAASAVSGTARWGVHTALDVTETVVRGSMAGLPPARIRTEAAQQLREALRLALGVTAVEAPGAETSTERSLREQGAALLRLAASTRAPDEGHPAFARILAELTSDEARILRLLRLDGPQPAVTVRGGRAARRRGGRRNEPRSGAPDLGVSMIGEHAGLRHPDRVQRYLANLCRIGLIEVLDDPVGTPERYQLLEAQESVRELLERSGSRGKLLHRGIALTPFGGEFVAASLPIAGEAGPAAETR
ncbi:Abi-alpha family protein [Nocardia sp. X0981]